MVQTYTGEVRVYEYPFEIVMAAYEKRFPKCPQIPIFAGSEITYECNARDGSTSIVERKCELAIEIPYLVKKATGWDAVSFTQKNSLDRQQRTLLIEAKNETFVQYVDIKETCRYYAHPKNPEWTCFEQTATLTFIQKFFGFEKAAEKLAIRNYSASIHKGREVLEYFINELKKGGVTTLPRFTPTWIGPIDDTSFRKRSEVGDNDPLP